MSDRRQFYGTRAHSGTTDTGSQAIRDHAMVVMAAGEAVTRVWKGGVIASPAQTSPNLSIVVEAFWGISQ